MINKLILKEGYKSVGYALALTIISALFICDFLTALLAIITLFLIYIFRNSASTLVQVSDIVSVCDGTVKAIDKQDGKSVIYISLGLLDSHTLRAPENSGFEVVKKRHGVNLDSDTYKAKVLNSQQTIAFDNLMVELLDGRCNFTTVIDKETVLSQGERFGVMTQGEIKITLNKDVKPKVKIGQKVCAGSTVLA